MIALLYALIIGLHSSPAPTLEHNKNGAPDEYVITNPLFVPITASIGCDVIYDKYEPVVVRVSARVSEVLYLQTNATVVPSDCKIIAWVKSK